MPDDAVLDIIGQLERPIDPPAGFGDGLLASLLASRAGVRRGRWTSISRRVLRPSVVVPIASAAALIVAYIAVGPGRAERVTTRPAAPGPTAITTNGFGSAAEQSQSPSESIRSTDGASFSAPAPGLVLPTPSSVASKETPDHTHRERRLAYSVYNGSDHDIWTLNLDTGERHQLTSGAGDDVVPSWSPDGHQLLFFRNGAGTMIINDDGTDLSAMVAGAYAVWSPDGTHIAYTGDDTPDGSGMPGSCPKLNCTGVWVMTIASGDSHFVTTGTTPAWSPDGTQLLVIDPTVACSSTYLAACDGTIYTVGLNGANRTSLGLTGRAPEYSPDGTRIVYQSGQGADADIHVANRDGSGDHIVIGGPEDDIDPTWSGVGYGLLFHGGDGNPAAEQGIQACDEDGSNRSAVVVPGEFPTVGWVVVPD